MIWKIGFVLCAVQMSALAFGQQVEITAAGSASDESADITANAGAAPETAPAPSAQTATTNAAPADATSETAAPEGAAAPAGKPVVLGDLLLKGHNAYLAGDFEGALAAYNDANAQKPGNSRIQYYIGCALSKLKRDVEAQAAFQTAVTVADDKTAGIAAKALFMIAVLEETRDTGDAIKTAWTAYKNFAGENQGVPTFVGSADARIAAYEKKVQLDEQYRVVRERIANSE